MIEHTNRREEQQNTDRSMIEEEEEKMRKKKKHYVTSALFSLLDGIRSYDKIESLIFRLSTNEMGESRGRERELLVFIVRKLR